MSMEEAILELAAGMKEVAAAIRVGFSSLQTAEGFTKANEVLEAELRKAQKMAGVHLQEAMKAERERNELIDAKAAELAEATDKRAAAAREAQAKDAKSKIQLGSTDNLDAEIEAQDKAIELAKAEAQPIKQDADLEQAVSKVEDDALAAPLEYTKDVRPVLLQLSKAKGKDELLGLLKKYGAKNGEAIKADDFAKIVADANALIGG